MNKCVKTILALAAALAAAAAAAYVLYIYWEKIVAKFSELKSLCPCGRSAEEAEEPAGEAAPEEEAPAEAPVEEAPAEEPASEEEPAVTEADFAD